ncbi:MAG: hypothetical protein WD004_04415 [Actinomycetota bacterium]
MSVSLPDAEPNGLVSILGDLIRANLEREPARSRYLARPASYAIAAHDIGLAATLRLGHGDAVLTNGAHPSAEVRVRTDAGTLLELSSVPLLFGFPSAFHRDGRVILKKLRSRRLRVKGLVGHPAKVARLNRLLSVD